jgi:NADP-dependent 3-hydroxy acid dehydrogenase YdfG
VGLGEAIATRLAVAGSRLILTDINEDTVNRVGAELLEQGTPNLAVVHDVADEKQWAKSSRSRSTALGMSTFWSTMRA